MYFFFFKQKTAYEMRISDWSTDVCSSDLPIVLDRRPFDRDLHADMHIVGIDAGNVRVEPRAGSAVEVDDDGDIDIILAGLRILVAHDIAEHRRDRKSVV